MRAPGATTSGLLKPSCVTPRLEKVASVSSAGSAVSASSVAPTEITNGSLPGAYWTASAASPRLPDGGDDDDAGVPGELDGRVERVEQVGARRVRADRQVDDVDVELVLVVDDELSALMTSRTVELPWSSAVLIATRSASGAMPA